MPKKFALTEDAKLRMNSINLVSGGLIAISLIILGDFISATSLDTPSFISVLSFAVAVPILSSQILFYNLLFRDKYHIQSIWYLIITTIILLLGILAALVGVAAAFWHISWIAGSLFLVVVVFLNIIGLMYYFPHMKADER